MINILLVLSLIFTPLYSWSSDHDAIPKVPFTMMVEAETIVCKKPVTYLLANQPAPCTGYLFSPEKEYEIRFKNESIKYMEELIATQKVVIDKSNQRIENFQQYSLELEKELKNRDKHEFWKSTLYFTLGAVLTGIIAANVR